MISGKMAAVIAVVILAVFGTITIETINHSGSSLSTTSLSESGSQITLYSPQNGTNFVATSSNYTFNVSLSIDSKSSSVYIYDFSPDNLSALQNSTPGAPQLYSAANLTHMNTSLYPYNYQKLNVTKGTNTTVNITLHLNSTAFSSMKVSTPLKGAIYPYVVEMLAETSSGAAAVGFTMIRV